MKKIEFIDELNNTIEDHFPNEDIKGYCIIVLFDDASLTSMVEGDEYSRMLGTLEQAKFDLMLDKHMENISWLNNCLNKDEQE